MKKSKLKLAVKNAVCEFYGNVGFTNTADKMLKKILSEIDKEYSKRHK